MDSDAADLPAHMDSDAADIAVLQRASGLRDAIIAPTQSDFRVLAILRYLDSSGKHNEVVGTNSEQCFIGGSLCAERAALSKLRHHDCARIERIFLVSDLDGPLTPGVLCREMLLSACDADTPVVMAGRGGGSAHITPISAVLE